MRLAYRLRLLTLNCHGVAHCANATAATTHPGIMVCNSIRRKIQIVKTRTIPSMSSATLGVDVTCTDPLDLSFLTHPIRFRTTASVS